MRLTKSHRAYFKAAKAVAEMSDFKKYHVGCIAVYCHKIISSGCNLNRTNPNQKRLNAYRFAEDTPHTIHAEVSCLLPLINRRDIDFSRVKLYIWRCRADGSLGIARPCKSCMHLIKELGIKNIYYTNEGGYSRENILY